MPGNRGRGRRRGGPSTKSIMRHGFNGVKFHPGVDPPDIVSAPWNHMTVMIAKSGDQVIKGSDVAPVIITQAGFYGLSALTIDFRVQKARFWCLTVKRPIRVEIYGFDNTSSKQGGAIAVLEDFPSNVAFAAVGYELPAALKNCVYSSDSDAKLFSVDVGAAYSWLGYVDVLWRGNNYTPITQTARYRALYPAEHDDSASSSSFSTIVRETLV